jgi:hypothetical protein
MATKLLSIEEIMTGVTAASQEIKQSAEKTKEIRGQQAAASARQGEIITQAGNDAAAVARQQGLALLNVQKENVRAAEAAGVTETSNALLDLLAAQKKANSRVLERAAEVTRKTESTIDKDGFFGWVANAITLQESKDKLAANVTESQAISSAIVNTNNALQETFTTNKGKAELTTLETIEAQSRIAAADAKVRAEQATIEGLGFNLAGVTAAKEATIEQLNLRYSGNQAVMGIKANQRAEEDQGLQRQRFEWEREQQGIRMEMLKAEKEDKAKLKKLSEDFVATVNLGRATLKQTPLDEVEQRTLLESFRSGQVRKDIQLQYQLGTKSRQNGGTQVFGNSAAAAAELVFDPELDIQVAASQEVTKGILAEAARVIPPQVKGSKDKAAISQAINKNVNEIVAQQFGTKEGVEGKGYIGSDSPFSVGDIGAAESGYLNAPVLKTNPLVVKVIQPLAAAGTKMKDPGAVVEIVKAAMRKGEVTSSQAAEGLSRIYQVANDMNQAQRNFAGYGIPLPNKGAQYIVKISGDKYDLTKPEHVQRLLMNPPVIKINMFNTTGLGLVTR